MANERMYLAIFREQPDVMTVPEVAKLLRIGINKAYGLVNSGKLSSIKLGEKIIVPKLCLISFLIDEKNYLFDIQNVTDGH